MGDLKKWPSNISLDNFVSQMIEYESKQRTAKPAVMPWFLDDHLRAHFKKLCNQLCPTLEDAVTRLFPHLNSLERASLPAFADEYAMTRVRELSDYLPAGDLLKDIKELEAFLNKQSLPLPSFVSDNIIRVAK